MITRNLISHCILNKLKMINSWNSENTVKNFVLGLKFVKIVKIVTIIICLQVCTVFEREPFNSLIQLNFSDLSAEAIVILSKMGLFVFQSSKLRSKVNTGPNEKSWNPWKPWMSKPWKISQKKVKTFLAESSKVYKNRLGQN